MAVLGGIQTAATSPRLLGEAAIRAGQVSKAMTPALESLYRMNEKFQSTYAPTLRTSRLIGATPLSEAEERKRKQEFLEQYPLK